MASDPNPLLRQVAGLDTQTAIERLDLANPTKIAEVLAALPPARANTILSAMNEDLRARVMEAAPPGTDWSDALRFPEGSVGRLIEDPPAVFRSGTSVATAIDILRETVRQRMVTYLFVVDSANRLIGVVAFRELLYAERSQPLDTVMLRNPFFLRPTMTLVDAMREVVTRHFPVYPVCEEDGTLVGQVRGQILFEQQAFEISAQAGAMVGVEKEERLATPLMRAFKFRHPWLQINLVTVFITAAVVGIFQDTVDKIVVLAMFLPVLGGQTGNLGCQALAVLLRGMTLGELKPGRIMALMAKEATLGLMNGLVTGALAGIAIFIVASREPGSESPLFLGLITMVAMAFSCVVAGLSGTAIPLILKKLGADPATASSIFLTTITDVVSMGSFLAMVTYFLM
ncbi:magnesium transporter [Arenimonas sp.]|uniref:magnesium transporter n=1 Tax=Arenimonas sp. TaxID=1872635 RepID=UPI0039E543AD